MILGQEPPRPPPPPRCPGVIKRHAAINFCLYIFSLDHWFQARGHLKWLLMLLRILLLRYVIANRRYIRICTNTRKTTPHGVCVAIGQCCLYAGYCDWGLGISCVMGHSRWFDVAWQPLVSLRETAAGLVAVSCGDRCKYWVSVYSSVIADVWCYIDKVVVCSSDGIPGNRYIPSISILTSWIVWL